MPAAQTQAIRLIELLPELEHTVVSERRPADQFFAERCRAHHEWGSRDRRIFGDTLFAYFRWRGWLTGMPPARALALAGWLDGLAHPALRELAAQAELKLPVATPENLHDKARGFSVLLGDEKNLPALLPDWALPLLAMSDGGAQQHIEAFQRRPPVWLRVAPGEVAAVLEFFNQQGPRAAAHPRVPGAVSVTPPANLQGLRTATGVAAIVQDLASQCVGLLCAPQPGERWWDVCAGAGGKTLHLAALMQNRGAILATDVRAGALRELERRAAGAGVTTVQTQRIKDAPTGIFDGVLVDAPCSGIGTWNRNPDMRWRTDAADVAAKAAVQRELLERAAQSVRPGGVLVFAVCTVTQAETLGVTEAFSRAHPEFRPEIAAHPLTGEKHLGTFWIWPWAGPCDGMLIARWRRV
ncbi:MAG: RsmB/NOP family class I SAM-dependent RNA methyltransferase [Kiritimatiellaeota bacterium]|nr:RsmB/NOP family class I SAM-dependent RNA methyltransferase [Kiritimatiellota bacterium]